MTERAAYIWFWCLLIGMVPAVVGMALALKAMQMPIWTGAIAGGAYAILMLGPVALTVFTND
jgi:hypothetical protein